MLSINISPLELLNEVYPLIFPPIKKVHYMVTMVTWYVYFKLR